MTLQLRLYRVEIEYKTTTKTEICLVEVHASDEGQAKIIAMNKFNLERKDAPEITKTTVVDVLALREKIFG
jgi:hypothetical protein